MEKIWEINKHGGWKWVWRVIFFSKSVSVTFIREVRVMTFLQRSFSTKTFNTPLTYNGVMCSGRHVRQDKLFFNRNVSNVRPNNRQFWRFALKQFFHDLKKFKKELKDNYFSFFEQQTYKKKKRNWSLALFLYH